MVGFAGDLKRQRSNSSDCKLDISYPCSYRGLCPGLFTQHTSPSLFPLSSLPPSSLFFTHSSQFHPPPKFCQLRSSLGPIALKLAPGILLEAQTKGIPSSKPCSLEGWCGFLDTVMDFFLHDPSQDHQEGQGLSWGRTLYVSSH